MSRLIRMTQRRRRPDWSHGQEGIDFVRCRICGERRRVISGRHLSKHEIDRAAYIGEYRLSPDELIAKDFRVIRSSRPDFEPNGKRDWITAIRKVYATDGQVFAGYLQQNYPQLYMQGVWLFGNWDKALIAAGFKPKDMRLRSSQDRKSIITQIRQMRKDKLPLYAKHVMKHRPKLFSSARRNLGSWKTALGAAGIKIPRYAVGRRIHKLVEALHDLDGESMNAAPHQLRACAIYYFGSLENGMVAAKTEPHVVSGWNKAKITAELKRMHRAKQSFSYGLVRRNYPSLVNATENHFGGWGNALYAAGIDPQPHYVRLKWRGPKLSRQR